MKQEIIKTVDSALKAAKILMADEDKLEIMQQGFDDLANIAIEYNIGLNCKAKFELNGQISRREIDTT